MDEQLQVNLTLTRNQAVVLFEWLSQRDEAGREATAPAEQRVLWLIEGQLEKILTEPLEPDYEQLVETARKTVNEER